MLNENLRNYPQEEQWLLTDYNQTVMYIPNVCVTVDDNSNYKFYKGVNIDEFHFGMDIDNAYLYPVDELDKEQLITLFELKAINEYFHVMGLNAVYLKTEFKTPYLIFNHNDHPNTFFKIPKDHYQKVTPNVVETLLLYSMENHLEKPFTVDVRKGLVTIDGTKYLRIGG